SHSSSPLSARRIARPRLASADSISPWNWTRCGSIPSTMIVLPTRTDFPIIRRAFSSQNGGGSFIRLVSERGAITSTRGLTRPARVAALDLPAPGRLLAVREVVLVAAGQRLERDQGRVVLEQDGRARGGIDVCLGRPADNAVPSDRRAVEPVRQLDPAER